MAESRAKDGQQPARCMERDEQRAAGAGHTACLPDGRAEGRSGPESWEAWETGGQLGGLWTQRDSPTAQRSANRSSPSSAWIRSFRLFLLAALFNTALNRGRKRTV